MKTNLKELFLRFPPVIRYGLNSCFVTVILYRGFGMHIVIANTIGVVTGFLIDYRLSVHFVFEHAEGKRGFSIYLITFLIGLVLADVLVYLSAEYWFVSMSKFWNALFSKGISIVVPFFFLYFLRKGLYASLGQRSKE